MDRQTNALKNSHNDNGIIMIGLLIYLLKMDFVNDIKLA